MRDEVLQYIENESNPARAMNILREFLQALVLRSLHESEAFTHLAFVGGTALRFAHGLPRYSEDLDFSLEQPDNYQPEKWLKKVKRDLELADLDVEIQWNSKTNVHKAWLKWVEILHAAGISPHPSQKLSIKIEIDTRPPAGAVYQRRMVTRHRLLALNIYDLPSLMAGKLHALITRGYPKGRDWYDLLWYTGLQPVPHPNLLQLQNALDQTQGSGAFEATRWREMIIERIRQLDSDALVADVAPFLEHPSDTDLINADVITAALNQIS